MPGGEKGRARTARRLPSLRMHPAAPQGKCHVRRTVPRFAAPAGARDIDPLCEGHVPPRRISRPLPFATVRRSMFPPAGHCGFARAAYIA
jgi:hypothetical protein